MPDKQLLCLLGEDKRYIYRAVAWMLTGSLCSIGFTACLRYGLHLLLTDAKASFCLLPFALGAVCTAVRFIATVPLIPVSIVAVSRFVKRIFAKYWGKYTAMGDVFLDSVQGLKELKLFRADARRQAYMNENAEEFRKITMKVLVMQLASVTIMDLVAFGGAGVGAALAVSGTQNGGGIAAVAASQPELLLLDEPTVGQDGEGLRTLLHALNLLHTRTGSTIVTVTHDRRCAGALCDRVAWLKVGRIKKTGGSELIEAAWGNSAVL